MSENTLLLSEIWWHTTTFTPSVEVPSSWPSQMQHIRLLQVKKKKKKGDLLSHFCNLSHHATTWLHARFDSKVLKRAPLLFRSLCRIVLQNKLQFLVSQFMVTLLRLSASWGKALNCGLIRWLLSQDLCNAIFRYVMVEEKALPSQDVINLGKTIHQSIGPF